MGIVIAVIVFVVVLVGYLSLETIFRKKKVSEDLAGRIAPDGSTSYHSDPKAENAALEQKKTERAESMEGILRSIGIDVADAEKKLRPRFQQAGINTPDAPILYLFFQRIVSVFMVVLAILFFMAGGEGLNQLLNMLLGLILTVVGIFGPHLYLENAIQKRKNILQRSFPDALDLLLVCVESGLALDAALSRVCKELGRAHPEITEELNRTRLELALLNDRTQALQNLADRTDLIPFRSLVAALIQTEKFGTSLSDTLRVLSEDYRQTRLMMAENKAGRLPTLLTLPLILLLMPAFMLIVLGPAILRVMAQGGLFGGAS